MAIAAPQTRYGTHLSLCDCPGHTRMKPALLLLGSRTPIHISEVQVHLSQDLLADSVLLPSRHLCDVAPGNQNTSQFALKHTQGLEYIIIAISCLSQNSEILYLLDPWVPVDIYLYNDSENEGRTNVSWLDFFVFEDGQWVFHSFESCISYPFLPLTLM